MKEVELKFLLNTNKDNFIKNCDKFYEKLMPRTQETTTMYDNKEEFMLKSNGRLRVRTGYKNYLSYKKPLTRKGIKKEIEFETEIKNAKEATFILKEIAYFPVSAYTRYRTIWKKGNVKIFLDEFSFGKFVEIEGNRKDIIKIAGQVGFHMKDNITKSYDGIYKEICIKKGIKPKAFIK